MCGWVAGEGEGGVDTEDRRLRPAECGYRDRDTGSQSTLRPRVQSIHSIHSIHSKRSRHAARRRRLADRYKSSQLNAYTLPPQTIIHKRIRGLKY